MNRKLIYQNLKSFRDAVNDGKQYFPFVTDNGLVIYYPIMKTGLCTNILIPLGIRKDKISEFFYTWKYYSGNSTYPVPNPDKNSEYAAENIYDAGMTVNDYYRGPYGKLRMNLLAHIMRHYR